jgi:hypothetical protein
MNWHQIKDKRTHEMHQVIADILRRSPEKLSQVSEWIERKLDDPVYSEQGKDALREWQDLMTQGGLQGVLQVLDDESDESDRLRQSSPFACLMPQDVRLKILQKYESLRTRTSLAGV